MTCETQECTNPAAQSSTSITVDVQAGCLDNKTRMAEMPAPFCAYTQGLTRFGSVYWQCEVSSCEHPGVQVSAGWDYTCATAFSGKSSVCFGKDNKKQGARGLAATLGKGVKLRQVRP